MPIAPNFTSILTKDWEINFLQCYPNGLLKHTELCNLFQLTAALHAELGGISFRDMQAFHQAWVLSRMRVEVKRLPKWNDTVTVKTWIQSLENSRSIRCLELYLNDEKLAGCETYWAVFNTQTRRPESLALPHDHFEKFSNNHATTLSFSKIDFPSTYDEITRYTVLLSDLDIVNHVNSVKYLEWCLNYIDPKALVQQELTSFDMNYIKEVSLHESVTLAQNKNTFVITKAGKVCFGLQLEMKP
ncbi:acyl-[acyl-carrier-protein] thioesterase [Flavobacterium aciduliphilum]|uniref:Acyl-ACP thioesterase-like protein n=1 Tax=Flavobacterium aciduliphilum TaxID=1101402 RepID=A0A328YMU9_9FLAO|nr:acyl-ACP thioesterase domain-containing protein [Flavobacterium aciduliphilum]RAR75438.1 acyl-ACP thioesterase-like protein [Flavobacterium aciduliphilum]